MGRLSIRSVEKLNDGRHAVTGLVNKVGNQGNSWKRLQVDYTPRPDALVRKPEVVVFAYCSQKRLID